MSAPVPAPRPPDTTRTQAQVAATLQAIRPGTSTRVRLRDREVLIYDSDLPNPDLPPVYVDVLPDGTTQVTGRVSAHVAAAFIDALTTTDTAPAVADRPGELTPWP